MPRNMLLFIGTDFVAHLFMNYFIPRIIENGITPVLIIVSGKTPNAVNYNELKRYSYYEGALLSKEIYSYIHDEENKKFASMSRDQIIQKYNLRVIETSNVNDPSLLNAIQKIDFIGAISVRCFQIFKSAIINEIRDKGFFCNSHPGALPAYRGVYCMLRTIADRQKRVGWTLHEIDEGIDTGRIITLKLMPNNPNKTEMQLMADSVPFLAEGWLDYIDDYMTHGHVESYEQKFRGDYYTYPTKNEMNHWHKTGAVKPLDPRDIVQFYYTMFIPEHLEFTDIGRDFKIFLINKVAQFETMLEMDATHPLMHNKSQSIAA